MALVGGFCEAAAASNLVSTPGVASRHLLGAAKTA